MAQTQSSVILLENDVSLSTAMERVLRASGFHTLAFRTMEDLEQAGAAPDAACLVFDASAADDSGGNLRQRLKIGLRTPLIFISGYDEDETRSHAVAAGAAVFLAKPFTGRALVEAIHRVLIAGSSAVSSPVPA